MTTATGERSTYLAWCPAYAPACISVTVSTAIGNAAFPVYLTSISDIDKIGGALGFILIALIWFYILSLAILAGAVINALRYELRDTGSLDLPGFNEGTA